MLTVILFCSAALAHIILRERLHIFGILGCVLCVVGSTTIVLHAPQEREIHSVTEVWELAMDPGNVMFQGIICVYGLIHSWVFMFICFFDAHLVKLKRCTFSVVSFAAFLMYAALVITAALILIFYFIPQYGQTHIMVYIGVCSLVGSLSVCICIWL